MSSQKLTKKQKKAIAFRERKGKGKARDDGGNDIPVQEDQGLASIQVADVEHADDGAQREEGGAAADGRGGEVVGKSRKRKREEEAAGKGKEKDGKGEKEEGRAKPEKKRKKAAKDEDEADAEGEVDLDGQKSVKKDKQRYILFVGNLKYTTSQDAIQDHFSACDPPPTIRLLTPKPKKDSKAPTAKSKGCAFLEFTSRNALQQALKLHHSTLDGRQINVELTAGGGGKSEQRITKLKQRNKELEAQRKKRMEKQQVGPQNKGEVPAEESLQRARFSSTSGVGDAPNTKHTWTVDDSSDPQKRKRGKKQKGGDKKPSFMATGVNAIPVG
ncbi:hypothetical protein OE88DRAFT_1730049 [Heliocybe sulcata]|uniref:RRM domain-containing protein n=1 Tax=Heliocybe sulcata TaxID=5364 RepID=A0A5C3NGR8_9AGAM|nr:hypothetical protein OE88DRAFT_1730049 [Heliocybe sulcata]